MASYNVVIQNEEGNQGNLSITGLVDGRQVAAVVRMALLPPGKSKAMERDRANIKAKALVAAYLAMPANEPNAAAIVVEL